MPQNVGTRKKQFKKGRLYQLSCTNGTSRLTGASKHFFSLEVSLPQLQTGATWLVSESRAARFNYDTCFFCLDEKTEKEEMLMEFLLLLTFIYEIF